MADKIEKIGKSLITDGKDNDRVYLMKLCATIIPRYRPNGDEWRGARYSKIFAKVPAWASGALSWAGMKRKPISGFYNGMEDAFFMAKYTDSSRKTLSNAEVIDEIIGTAQEVQPISPAG
jgi:hypothetical protein